MSDMMSQGWLGVGGEWLEDRMNKPKEKAEAASNRAIADAEAKSAADAATEEEKKRARAALLAQSSSGFMSSGTNTARQFLTSL